METPQGYCERCWMDVVMEGEKLCKECCKHYWVNIEIGEHEEE